MRYDSSASGTVSREGQGRRERLASGMHDDMDDCAARHSMAFSTVQGWPDGLESFRARQNSITKETGERFLTSK